MFFPDESTDFDWLDELNGLFLRSSDECGASTPDEFGLHALVETLG